MITLFVKLLHPYFVNNLAYGKLNYIHQITSKQCPGVTFIDWGNAVVRPSISRDGLVVWCLAPLSTIFQLYRGGQFYWWRKPEDPKNHRPAASHWQTLSHNVVHLALSGSRTHTISVFLEKSYPIKQ